jgi:hypothetical protein
MFVLNTLIQSIFPALDLRRIVVSLPSIENLSREGVWLALLQQLVQLVLDDRLRRGFMT